MKKIIIAAVSAVLTLSAFTSCNMNANFTSVDAVGKTDGTITYADVKETTGGYWDTASGIDKDEEALYFNCGSYASYEVKLKDVGYDLTNAEVSISMKAAEGFAAGETEGDSSKFKFGVKTSDTMASEYTTHEDEVFIDIAKLVESAENNEYVTFKFNTKDMWKLWSADDSIQPAYMAYIDTFVIAPQKSCTGKVFINEIKVKKLADK